MKVRAAAVFALGTTLDVGFDTSRDGHGEEDCDDDEKVRAEAGIIKNLINVVSDGSPLVRAEVAVGMYCFFLPLLCVVLFSVNSLFISPRHPIMCS